MKDQPPVPASIPAPDGHAALRAALRRDAERLSKPPFDAGLHHATMRQIRALAKAGQTRAGSAWKLAYASGMAALVLGVAALCWPGPPPRAAARVGVAAVNFRSRATLWTYERAAARGDEVLCALLDQDARTLLPPSPNESANRRDFPEQPTL